MFNIGFGELMVVLAVAFVVVGPDDLPKVARWLGRQLRRLRQLMRRLKDETGWSELEAEVDGIRRDVGQTVREMDVTADLREAVKEVRGEVEDLSRGVKADVGRLERDAKAEAKALDAEVRSEVDPGGDAPEAAEDAATDR